MANQRKISVVVTAVAILTPWKNGTTPLLGGAGREAILRIPKLPNTAVFKLQGAPTDPVTNDVPVSGSALWTDIVTINASSDQQQELTDLPLWMRANVTTLEATTPTVIYLEGKQ
jgi:hypothetical protein